MPCGPVGKRPQDVYGILIMGTLAGILLLLLPLIFKYIEKRLQKETAKTTAVPEDDEARPSEEAFEDLSSEDGGFVDTGFDGDCFGDRLSAPAERVAEMRPEPVMTDRVESAIPARNDGNKKALETPEPENEYRIDPKKLVIYSEIMKPKF